MINKPLRILHVVTIMDLGGIETLLMSIYRGIDRKKIQFDFLVHRTEQGYFDEEIKGLGGQLLYICPLNPITYFTYKKKLLKILRENNYNIIHSHLNANSSIVLNIAKKYGIKNRIAHSHIDKTTDGIKGVLKGFTKLFINSVATHRFACSKQAGEWLYGNKMNFQLLTNAIESKRFVFNDKKRSEVRKSLNINNDDVVIGNIARFNTQKNHKFIIPLFAVYLKEYSNSKLLLIGEGELKNEIEDIVNELNLAESVIFTGAVGNANDFLNAMDVFLFPSLFEGLGIVAIEAQVNGLPVVLNENLPNELNVTDLIYRQSLEEPYDKWVKTINMALKYNTIRKDRQADIIKKGYDISENLRFLEEFYLKIN